MNLATRGAATLKHQLPGALETNFSDKVVILGNGINALTTQLYLELIGIPTVAVTAKTIDFNERADNPEMASLFGCASIITHSQNCSHLSDVMKSSQDIFHRISETGSFGVRSQRHYEVFETPKLELPGYVRHHPELNYLPPTGGGDMIAPRRDHDRDIYGWHFRCVFVEPESYIPEILRACRALSGDPIIHSITPEDLRSVHAPNLVNCTGASSHRLFFDSHKDQLIQGFLVYGSSEEPLRHPKTQEICSYNYRPKQEEYPSDVYLYPMSSGGFTIGGSRRDVSFDPSSGEWRGEDLGSTTIKIPKFGKPSESIDIPSPILTITQDILNTTFKTDLPEVRDLRAVFGLRCERDGGPRLEESVEANYNNTRVFHNRGQGGAGFSLSWGSAERVTQLVLNHLSPTLSQSSIENRLISAGFEPHRIRQLMMLRNLLLKKHRLS